MKTAWWRAKRARARSLYASRRGRWSKSEEYRESAGLKPVLAKVSDRRLSSRAFAAFSLRKPPIEGEVMAQFSATSDSSALPPYENQYEGQFPEHQTGVPAGYSDRLYNEDLAPLKNQTW